MGCAVLAATGRALDKLHRCGSQGGVQVVDRQVGVHRDCLLCLHPSVLPSSYAQLQIRSCKVARQTLDLLCRPDNTRCLVNHSRMQNPCTAHTI